MSQNENLFFYITNQDLDDEKNSYKNRIKEVNLLLSMNGFTEIGDLFDPSLYSCNKTINVINSLLSDRQKLIEAKSEILHKLSRTESEYLNIIDSTQTSKEKLQEINKKNEFFKNKLNNDEKKFKEDLDKYKIEKSDLEKTVNRLTMKESQYKHEIKKNEKDIEELKNKLKKFLNEKNNSTNNLTNTINKTQNFEYNKLTFGNEKNTNNNLNTINHFKEFYSLIYQALNEKVNHILSEYEEMKSYYKIIMKEINQYIDYKKLIVYKFSQDSIEEMKTELKDNPILNFNIFELDFSDNKETILTNFNEILNSFRFLLIYDILKVDPNSEFDFDQIKKLINNKKFDYDQIPYYNKMKETLDTFDFSKLNNLKENIMKSNFGISLTSRRKLSKDEIFVPDSNSEKMLINNILNQENKGLEHLEEINKDLMTTMNNFDEMFDNIESELNSIK